MDLLEEENVCSSASKRGKYRREVEVGQQSTQAVPFIIIPMREGQYSIHVKAAVRDSSLSDGIEKKLRVVVSGGTFCSYERNVAAILWTVRAHMCVCVLLEQKFGICCLSHNKTGVLTF